jgi:hypothetical protein
VGSRVLGTRVTQEAAWPRSWPASATAVSANPGSRLAGALANLARRRGVQCSIRGRRGAHKGDADSGLMWRLVGCRAAALVTPPPMRTPPPAFSKPVWMVTPSAAAAIAFRSVSRASLWSPGRPMDIPRSTTPRALEVPRLSTDAHVLPTGTRQVTHGDCAQPMVSNTSWFELYPVSELRVWAMGRRAALWAGAAANAATASGVPSAMASSHQSGGRVIVPTLKTE